MRKNVRISEIKPQMSGWEEKLKEKDYQYRSDASERIWELATNKLNAKKSKMSQLTEEV